MLPNQTGPVGRTRATGEHAAAQAHRQERPPATDCPRRPNRDVRRETRVPAPVAQWKGHRTIPDRHRPHTSASRLPANNSRQQAQAAGRTRSVRPRQPVAKVAAHCEPRPCRVVTFCPSYPTRGCDPEVMARAAVAPSGCPLSERHMLARSGTISNQRSNAAAPCSTSMRVPSSATCPC